MSKVHVNKLIKKFESAINKYVAASSDPLVNKNLSPNFEKIEEFLKKNKASFKDNKRGYAARQLSEFHKYLKNLNGDDRTIRLKNFYEDNKIIVLSGKAVEAYKVLLKTVEGYLLQKDHREKTTFPTTTHDSLSTGIKSVTDRVAKNAAILTDSLSKSLVATARNPWLSFKAATSFALYALANQPVAGMVIASNMIKKRDLRTDTITSLLSSEKSSWFRFYDNVEVLLKEFDNYLSRTKESDKRLFFEFLEAVITSGNAAKLSAASKDRLFNITKKELEDTFSNFNEISDVEKIYRLFFIFSRLKYKDNRHYVQTIFELLDKYIKKLTSHRIAFSATNKSGIEHKVRNLFWILQVNFNEYAKSLVDFFGVDNFKRHFNVLQKMNQEIYRWDSDSIFSFRLSLDIMSRLQFDYLKDNQAIGSYLNNSAHAYIAKMLRLVENDCLSLSVDEIKEAAYIVYVRRLPSKAKESFVGLYKEVKKSKVFPHNHRYKVLVSDNTPEFVVYSQQPLNDDEKIIVEKTIDNTYQRVESLKSSLGVLNKEDISEIAFRLHLFKDNEAYVNYGPLWGVNTAGGGYAHVRNPGSEELQFYDSNRFQGEQLWYETFIYQQKGDTRNAKNKEGGSFRNLGHEIQHTLFYAMMGKEGLHNLPAWLVEGIANYLGNEDCFKEEADHIKTFQEQNRLLSVMHIINLSYANGGDLYYFGSTLVRYMLAKHPYTLKRILIKAQQDGEQQSEINQIIKQWAATPTIEDDFKTWTTRLINQCSEKNNGEGSTTKIDVQDVQTEYLKDLQNNPELLRFIQRNGFIKFTFGNISFTLYEKAIYAINLPENTEATKPDAYRWFKEALAIYAVQNKLTNDSPTEEHYNQLASYFINRNAHYIKDSTVKNVYVYTNNTNFKQIIEDFALKTCFPVAGKKSLSNSQFERDVKKIQRKEALSDTCQAHLTREKAAVVNQPKVSAPAHSPNKVQTEYLKDLQNNPELEKFIQRNGPIEFTFNDIIFALYEDKLKAINLHKNYQKTPKIITLHDYRWFKNSLAIYVVQSELTKNDKTYEMLARYFSTTIHDIKNRTVENVKVRANNTNFKQIIEDFALKTCFPIAGKKSLSREELHKKLKEFREELAYFYYNLSSVKRPLNPKIIPTSTPTSTTSESSTTSKPSTAITTEPSTTTEPSITIEPSTTINVLAGIGAVLGLVAVGGTVYFFKQKEKQDMPADKENKIRRPMLGRSTSDE